jgi:hypothetical protein
MTETTLTILGRPMVDHARGGADRRARGDRAEGVISAAIAVLVMAGIGALMWVGFRAMWETTESNTNEKVEEIGQ